MWGRERTDDTQKTRSLCIRNRWCRTCFWGNKKRARAKPTSLGARLPHTPAPSRLYNDDAAPSEVRQAADTPCSTSSTEPRLVQARCRHSLPVLRSRGGQVQLSRARDEGWPTAHRQKGESLALVTPRSWPYKHAGPLRPAPEFSHRHKCVWLIVTHSRRHTAGPRVLLSEFESSVRPSTLDYIFCSSSSLLPP